MALDIKDPIVVPAKVFNKYWMRSIEISAPIVGQDARAAIFLIPTNDKNEADYENPKIVVIENILENISAGDQKLAAEFQAIMAAIEEKL